jgi:hypothetical protein
VIRNDDYADEADIDPLDELRRLPKSNRWARADIEDTLLTEFDESPEALELSAPPIDLMGGMDAPFLLTRLIFQWFDETIASMQPKQLEEILFMTIPCTEPFDPEYARTFIEQAIAFVRFLGRAHAYPQAAELLGVLDGDTAERFEARVRDMQRP